MILGSIASGGSSGYFVDQYRPVLSNFRIDSDFPDRIYFDSSKLIQGTTFDGFTVPYRVVTGMVLSASKYAHYLTLNFDNTFFHISAVEYDGSNDVADLLANPLASFSKEWVRNDSVEPDASTFRFATVSGLGTQDGLTEANAWSIATAVSTATSGMTVFCKAGGSSSAQLDFVNSGTVTAPIKFIGYKTDYTANNYQGDITTNYFANTGGAYDTNEMFTLDGGNRASTSSVAMDFQSSQYIIIKNFQVENYKYGYYGNVLGAQNIVFYRCNGQNFGNLTGTGLNADKGYAFMFDYASNEKIQAYDCRFANATQTIMYMAGVNHLIKDCQTYASDGTGIPANDPLDYDQSPDYHLILDTTNTIVIDSRHEHLGEMEHAGHGISLKEIVNATVTGNLIDGASMYNLSGSLEFRHPQVQNNLARNIYMDLSGGSVSTTGIVFRDGASYNTVENSFIEGQPNHFYSPINYFESSEEGYNNTIQGNIVQNSVFKGTTGEAIRLGSSNSSDVGTVLNNYIKHCTFDTFNVLAQGSTLNTVTGFYFQNCLFNNITNKTSGTAKTLSFDNCLFWGGFTGEGTNPITLINPVLDTNLKPTASFNDLKVVPLSGILYSNGEKERFTDFTTVGAKLHDEEIKNATLLFKSGFETDVAVLALGDGVWGSDYQGITGGDEGFDWGATLIPSYSDGGISPLNPTTPSPSGIHIVEGGWTPPDVITNTIINAVGHDGTTTKVLRQYKVRDAGATGGTIPSTIPFQINNILNIPNKTYIRFWVKDDFADAELSGVDQWSNVWGYKSGNWDSFATEPTGYRTGLKLVWESDYLGYTGYAWTLQGDKGVGGGANNYYNWSSYGEVDPSGGYKHQEWNLIEILQTWATDETGGTLVRINGNVLYNIQNIRTLGTTDSYITFMTLWANYGYANYTTEKLIDDVQIWSDDPQIAYIPPVLIYGDDVITNGTFDTDITGWSGDADTFAWSAGFEALVLTRTTGNARFWQLNVMDLGKVYKLVYEIKENNSCTDLRVYGELGYETISNTVGVHEYTFTCGLVSLQFLNNTDSSDITIDNVSLKEVL